MKSSRTQSYALVLIQFACLLGIAASGLLVARHPLLLLVEGSGFALAAWTMFAMLPRAFNIVPDVRVGNPLVQHGPYRWIRHPMYASLLLITLPLVIQAPSLWRWLLWAGLLVDLLVKLRYEERLLGAHYPEYANYRQQTKRLIPFLF